jgi:hypothetical protein
LEYSLHYSSENEYNIFLSFNSLVLLLQSLKDCQVLINKSIGKRLTSDLASEPGME